MSARIRDRHKLRAKRAVVQEIQAQLGAIEIPYIPQGELGLVRFPPHRHVMGTFLNEHGLTGEGAEIGVLHGSFSMIIMNAWQGAKLHLIDPWCRQNPDVYTEPTNDADWEYNIRVVMQRMEQFWPRVNIIRALSKDAVKEFKDGQLDWVYIDANHTYHNVLEDLELWSKKVRPGGLIAGHDYGDNAHCVVKMAVDEFLKRKKWPPIAGLSGCSSFWMWKPV